MNKLVSVIIPVYNVEKYICECIESVINQTYKNLQIIIINDGSTDNSKNLCNKYANKDNRIIIVNKKNGGAASAKNIGIDIAEGDYIAFLDGDDYLNLDAIEYMVNLIENYNSDIAHCDFYEVYKNKNREEDVIKAEVKVLETEEMLRKLLTDWKTGLFTNKMFKKEVIKGIHFIEGRCIDDDFFTYKCIMKSKSIVVSNKITYNYRMRLSSVMQSSDYKKQILIDRINLQTERYENIISSFPYLDKDFFYAMLDMFIILSRDYFIDEVIINDLKLILKKYIKKMLFSNINISIKVQILRIYLLDASKLVKEKKDCNEKLVNTVDYFN